MYQDFKDLLSCFSALGVKYLIVGGYAVSFHAQPRFTKDNAISETDLADPPRFIRFGREPVAVDILPGVDGLDFDAAWENRVESIIDPATGLTAFFISKEDLIASKVAAGRMRDLADVEELREATESETGPE